ncbi:hypothetical protein [Streptomyces hydrogenans]|jgi:hypothetical protein|uniref:hypothetical protein n=1 Tax=Streptomyces hydrogenans TaxID=1873719 RepID=UPI0036E563D9
MALIDDIEFYGRSVEAGELDRPTATRLLVEASNGGLTQLGAEISIARWSSTRAQLEKQYADTVDALRALENGKPIPEHVTRHMREGWKGYL